MATGFGVGLASGWEGSGWAPGKLTNNLVCYSPACVLGGGGVSIYYIIKN